MHLDLCIVIPLLHYHIHSVSSTTGPTLPQCLLETDSSPSGRSKRKEAWRSPSVDGSFFPPTCGYPASCPIHSFVKQGKPF
ncbi:hypothetical protein BDU57DRAFT_512382 [Ampelomyces quisqualis]|uniref:Uncharacterized protein n=1 Tax=Ampelomyces quisqualis TaxID=50730 RepID=A0A6A5QWM6_AMPQU|nr:hypothetical protein BDU57DRAFT_512382 [Ampelomyces quisqualis]